MMKWKVVITPSSDVKLNEKINLYQATGSPSMENLCRGEAIAHS